jgi:hypothetical protein
MQIRIILSDHHSKFFQSISVEKIPVPLLQNSIQRLRTNVTNFEEGTKYEIAVVFLSMLRKIYKIAEESPEQINDQFQLTVLTALSDLLEYYRYHRETQEQLGKSTTPFHKLPYKSSLFSWPLQNRRNQALGLTKDSKTHPENLLRETALIADNDPLSNISICRDPFCGLTILDEESAKKYAEQVKKMIANVPTILRESENQKLTWIAFASGHLGLTVMRLHDVFTQFNEMKQWPKEIEIVFIDIEYNAVIANLKNSEEKKDEKSSHSVSKNQIQAELTETAIKQFCQFLATEIPTETNFTVQICDNIQSFMRHNASFDSTRMYGRSTIVECDDVWIPGGSSTFHHSDKAQADFSQLLHFVSTRSFNGEFFSVFKDDTKRQAILQYGDLKRPRRNTIILNMPFDKYDPPPPTTHSLKH